MTPSTLRSRTAAAVSLLLLLGCFACAPASASRLFSPDSVWNAALPDGAVLDPGSDGLVGELNRQVTAYGPWVNVEKFSVPIVTVPADQPGVPVHIDRARDMWTNAADARALERQLDLVPIPPGTRPASGTDMHLVIWQPSTDTMWELWQARDTAVDPAWGSADGGWHASWGSRIDHVSESDGVNQAPFGATASGLELAGGLITAEDLRSGHIDHALAVALPETKRGSWVAPANRTDGAYTGPSAIPEGTRFRLPADLDIDRLHLPRVSRMLAEAAQRYGVVVRDRAGAVVFYVEDPASSKDGIFSTLLGKLPREQMAAAFPWSRLQVVSPTQPEAAVAPAPDPVAPADTPGVDPPPVDPPPVDPPPVDPPPVDPPSVDTPNVQPPPVDEPAAEPTPPADPAPVLDPAPPVVWIPAPLDLLAAPVTDPVVALVAQPPAATAPAPATPAKANVAKAKVDAKARARRARARRARERARRARERKARAAGVRKSR
jgi:hypothetical protein